MPRVIQRALFEKVAALPEWWRFREDVRELCGVEMVLVDEQGTRAGGEAGPADPPMCRLMAGCAAGRAYCARFRQRLLAAEPGEIAHGRCDAGMQEWAVPLVVTGQRVGHLVFFGYRDAEVDAEPIVRRIRHLLELGGIARREQDLRLAHRESPELAPNQAAALARVVAMGSQVLAEHFTPALGKTERGLPELVRRARVLIQQGALVGGVSLAETARRLRVSESHLSREFHRGTGLTFGDYLARLRARQARDMLLHTRKSVSEIALDAGFGSISQFNRVFRRIYGAPPGDIRRTRKT